MYRLLIFIVLLVIADAKSWCRGPLCQKSHQKERISRYPEEPFHKLAHYTITMERKFENYCRYNTHIRVSEMYGPESYVLRYSIPEFQAKDLVIKVMHRAIYVNAERWDPTGLKNIRDVKMLPDNLNTEVAKWSLQDGELQIIFPYKTPLYTEIMKPCGNINYAVINLPMDQEQGSTREFNAIVVKPVESETQAKE